MAHFAATGFSMVELTHRVKHLLKRPSPEDVVNHDQNHRVPTLGPLLIFNDHSLEEEFLKKAHATWTKCDMLTFVMGMVITGPKIISFSTSDVSSKYMHAFAMLVVGFIAPGALLIHVYENQDAYHRRRTRIMSCVKLVVAVGQSMVAWTEDPFDIWNAKDFPHLLVRGFSRTPFLPMIVLALGNPIPFWWHVVIQGLICIPGASWIPGLCGVCVKMPRVREAISYLGQITEGYLAFVGPSALGVSEVPSEYSCRFVASFYTVLLQFLIPSYIVYLLECEMRLQYLKGKLSEDEAALQSHLKFSLVTFATIVLIVCSQIAWYSGRG